MRHPLWVARVVVTLLCVLPLSALASTCEIEIEQPLTGRGFFFSADTQRWQEFVPSRSTVCEVRLWIRSDRLGGDLILHIVDDSGAPMGEFSIDEADVVLGDAQYLFEFVTPVHLDETHRLVLRSSQPDVFPAAYFWMGDETSTYEAGVSDVDVGGLPGFDYAFALSTVTSTAAPDQPDPRPFVLHHPIPNPFNPYTEIPFELARGLHVRLSVHDIAGRKVVTLTDRSWDAGRHTVTWDGRDAERTSAASGVYLFRLEAGGCAQTRRGVLVK